MRLLSGSHWFYRFTWFLIIIFSLSSTPHVELCLSCLFDLVIPTAYAEEQAEGKTSTEDAHTTTEKDTQQKETPSEGEKDKNLSSQPMMGSGLGGAGESIAGALSPSITVSQFAGAATAKIPVEVPPGRKGMAPKLALTYSSQQGNGWVGVGWTIDMGAIQRSTKRGASYTSDTYVAVINGSSAELVSRTDWGANYYGARIEGILSKYYFNTVTGGWEVTSRDGTKYYYGSTASSRQDFENGTRVFKWCLDRVEDVNGNFMTVSYTKDQGEIYLDQIGYTGNRNTGLSPAHSLIFYIESRTDTPLIFTTNYQVKTAKRLKTIEVRANGTMVRAYTLTYATSASTSRSLLGAVTAYGADAALDGEGTITGGTPLPPVRLSWDEQKTHTFVDSAGFLTYDVYSWSPSFWAYGDFNGDGKTDVCYYPNPSDNSRKIKFGNGDGTFTDGPRFKVTDIYSWDYPYWAYGDFNGDGKTDIIYYTNAGQWKIKFSNGDGTFTDDSLAFTVPDAYSYSSSYWSYGDFNGDGKTDIIYHTTTAYQKRIKFSNGDGTFTDGPGFFMNDTYSWDSPTYVAYGDFNGDGKTDIIYHTTTAYQKRIKFSNGDGTFTDGPFVDMGTTIVGWDSPTYLTYGDFNGDGKTDIIYRTTTGTHTMKIKFSNGDGTFIDSPEFNTNTNNDIYSWDSPTYVAYGDFNGDGKTDIIYHTTTAYQKRIKFSEGTKDLLISLTNSLGGQTSLTYTPSSAYENTLLPFILQTVSSIKVEDGRGSTQMIKYIYEGGLFNYTEREFLGFRKVTSYAMYNDASYETKTETQYYQDLTRKGVIEEQTATSYEGHTRKIHNDVTAAALSGGATWPRLDRATTTIADAGATSYATTIEYDHDGCLNITGEHRSGIMPEDTIHTYSTYTCPNSRWIIGKPKEVKVKDSAGNIVSAKWMDYDSAGNLTTEETCRSDTPATGCRYRSSQNPTIRYAYTSEGNLSFVTDPEWKKTTYTYDATKTYVYETTNALNHVTTTVYDPGTGKLTKLIPPHLQGTTYSVTTQYDVFGRITKEMRPDGGYTTYQYLLSNPTSQYVEKTEHIVGGANHYTYTLFDGLGRVYSTQAMGDEGYTVMADTSFDSIGRVATRSIPYRYGIDDPVYTTITYDGLSRVTTTTYPDNTSTFIVYQGLTRETWDQNWNVTTSTYDVYGRLREVIDPHGPLTTYTYDTLGDLVQVVAAKGQAEENTTTMTYDSLGRKTSMTDPDMGHWTYSYDKRGNLVSQTDAKTQTITFTYDAMNRLISKVYPAHTVTYTYDDPSISYSTGMLTATSDPSGGENTIDSVLTLDCMQRVTRSTKTINTESLTISKTYDSAGRTITMTYETDPKRSFTYRYDWAGNLLAVHDDTTGVDHVRYADFTALGQPATALFPKPDGSLVKTTYTYDPYTNRLTHLLTEKTHQSTKTEACALYTGEPTRTTTYACDLTQQAFDTEQGCTDACRQTTGCTPVTFSGKATSGVNGTIRTISANGNTLSFTCDICESYWYCPDDINCGWQTYCSTPPCGTITASAGTFSGSVDAGPDGSIRAVSVSGNTLSFDCGSRACGTITASNGTLSGSVYGGLTKVVRTMAADGNTLRFDDGYSSLGTITANSFCPYGTQYTCDANHACTKEGTCTPHTDLSCPLKYTLTGATCTAYTCPLGNQYACSGTPSACTGLGMDVDATLQDLTYEYDPKGNITILTDNVKGITHEYRYDNLNRLIYAQGTGNGSYEQSYDYDAIGNITYKSDVGTYAYTYANTPHAVRQAGNISLQYDPNGNMTQRYDGTTSVTLDIAWNEDNKPSVISKNGTGYIRFTYDGSGQRVRKENILTGATILYFGEVYEVRNGKEIIHLFANNQRVVSIHADGRMQYYHGDHLGSSSVITDQNGEVKEQIAYYPFGTYRERKDLDPSFPDVHHTFTGQEDDDETGLYNYNARLYDPVLGRFISADSLVPEPGNLQAFNRYSYCLNNPVIYTDPSGHWFGIDDIISAVIGAIIGGVSAAINGGNVFEGMAIGAASGWVGWNTGLWAFDAAGGKGLTAILTGGITGGAASGATGGGLSALVHGGDIGESMLRGAGIGALGGAVTGGLIGFNVPPMLAAMGGGAAAGYVECGDACAAEGALYALMASVSTALAREAGFGMDGTVPSKSASLPEKTTYAVSGDRKDGFLWRLVSILNEGFTHTMHSEDSQHFGEYWPDTQNPNYPRYIRQVQSGVDWQHQTWMDQSHNTLAQKLHFFFKENCTTRFGYMGPGVYTAHHFYTHRTYWWFGEDQ